MLRRYGWGAPLALALSWLLYWALDRHPGADDVSPCAMGHEATCVSTAELCERHRCETAGADRTACLEQCRQELAVCREDLVRVCPGSARR